MLTDEEIIKAVRRIRYSSKADRNARKTPSVHGLAVAAGIDPDTVYNVAKSGRMSDETRARLGAALDLPNNP